MTTRDAFGVDIALDNPDAADCWNRTMLGFLSHAASTPQAIAELIERAPDFALARASRGLLCLILARSELVEHARADHAAALAGAAGTGADKRTTVFIAALGDWLAGHPSRAARRLDALAARSPHDAFALKLCHAIRFMLGDTAGMRRSIESAISHYPPAHPATGYMHGCLAFALEETGCYARAEVAGRRGLELAPDDAWGLHAITHVYDMTGRPREGVRWINERPQAWSHCNNFRYHVWWHLALHHLDLGEADRAVDLYDSQIRRDHTDDFRDIANAASMLARLEIEGIDVGTRWDELADIAERRIDDGSLVFADLHYLMSLLGAGRHEAAGRLVDRIARSGRTGESEMDGIARHPGAAAAQGLDAFWKGRPHAALDKLLHARGQLQAVGGSRAQRDVFERLTIEAALRAREHDIARALIEERFTCRGVGDRFARRSMRAVTRRGPAMRMPMGTAAPQPAL